LNITMKSISFYPQINAIEVYEIVDIPLESSSTTGLIPCKCVLNDPSYLDRIDSSFSLGC
jgi:hypothetical protein